MTAIGNGLEAYLGERLGYASAARIREHRVASQGMSDRTVVLRVTGDHGERDDLVVRLQQSGGLLREESDPTRHFRVLRALRDGPVPVPRARWYEHDESVMGGPFFVMDEVPGHVPVPWSPDGRAFLERAGRGPIGASFSATLATIHGLEWRGTELADLDPPRAAGDFAGVKLEDLERSVATHQREPEPILADALAWLRENVPPAAATTLVHGDYRSGNLVYDGDRIAAVLDWEFACLGDPTLDLAWVCAASNRMDSQLVCHMLPREAFLDGYAELTGRRPSAESLRFWELYHQVRHTAMWLSAAGAYASGRSRDLRLARMSYVLPVMRRMVADLLGGYA